ncbi:methyltransferase [Marinimicrobium sp. ABcell2]|uniref:methyltransferase n=1 Tax=Marinimicrobium sp. ABcell2 TaxID=3069751 RepID=UPI0027B4BDF4|nr:methyltransferase [Marinimicrobium sp. ABcell2]MDQ2075509.1 methyltransferase [Marinimicrobium sp. ABcell2]
MADTAAQWLLEQLQNRSCERSLWCSDEHWFDLLPATADWTAKPRVITNRYDVFAQAQALNLACEFSDFDFSAHADQSVPRVFYRISKEKPLVHHIINEAKRVLVPGGELFLCGQKNEGIKTYADKAAQLFGCSKNLKKIGPAYAAILERKTDQGQPLDDNDYTRERPIIEQDDLRVFSKPGLFGWDKVDQGSEYLVSKLPDALSALTEAPRSLLDLGCGYGYLALMTRDLPMTRRVLTDNNAAAVALAEVNCRENHLDAEVIAADCGDHLQERFDVVLCNPPFHQGFSVSGELTQRFLKATQRLLSPSGVAIFVVNAFIPLENLAAERFRVKTLGNNGRFKVIQLQRL